jgi:hypothetical protein
MSAEEWTHQADVTPGDEPVAALGEPGAADAATPTSDGDDPTTAVAGSTLAATEAEA